MIDELYGHKSQPPFIYPTMPSRKSSSRAEKVSYHPNIGQDYDDGRISGRLSEFEKYQTYPIKKARKSYDAILRSCEKSQRS